MKSNVCIGSVCFLFILTKCKGQSGVNYFLILEENNVTCMDRCAIVSGICNEQVIGSLSSRRYTCLQSFRSLLGTSNIKFAQDSIDNTQKGGCIARNAVGYVEVQTATLQSDCNVGNPISGGWKRLCPCTVSSMPNVSAVPTAAPSKIPTPPPTPLPTSGGSSMPTTFPTQFLRVQNTIYVIGINVSFIESGCGVDQFHAVMTSSIASILGINESDVTDVYAYDFLVVGLEYQVVAVTFKVNSDSVEGGPAGIDKALDTSIRSGELLATIKSNGHLWNCSLGNSGIGGYNGDIPGYTVDRGSRDPCSRFDGGTWRRLYSASSYGPWATVITIFWAILTTSVLVMALRYTSCVSYGAQQRMQFKYLWAVMFAAVTCRFVVASVVLTAWQTNGQDMKTGKGFACAEMNGYTPSDVSQRSMQSLLLLYHALMTCMLAGIVYHYHGDVVAATTVSSGLACIAYGPYIWLLVILYLVLCYGSSQVLSESDRETADVVVQALIGGVTLIIAILWMVDLYANSRLWMSLRHYIVCAYVFACYGVLTLVTSFDSVTYSPGSSLVLKCIFLHIVEVVAICSTILSLWILLRRAQGMEVELFGGTSTPAAGHEPTKTPRPPVQNGRRRFRRDDIARDGGVGLAQQEHKASSDENSGITIDTMEQEREMALAMQERRALEEGCVMANGSGESRSTQSDAMSGVNILRDPYHQCQDRDLHVGVLTTGTDDGTLQYEDSVAYFNL